MAIPRHVVLLVGIAFLALTAFTAASANADNRGAIADPVDIDAPAGEATCLSGTGSSLTVSSPDDATIWIRLHLAGVTDSGGSFGAELAGSTADHRIIEVIAGVEYTGGGFQDFITDPFEAYDLVSGVELQLPMFDGVMTGLDDESVAGNGASAGTHGTEATHAGSLELLEC